jgi:hypothetical protein
MRGIICLIAASALACGGSSETVEPATEVASSGGDETTSTTLEAAAPIETPTEVRELGPSADDGEGVAAWIAERATSARAGTRQFVRIPLAYQSTGWGCRCPQNYVGGSPDEHAGGNTWLSVVNDSGGPLPEPPSEMVEDGDESYERNLGQVLSVDGYFDGETVEEDLREGPDGPEEWVYQLHVFHVTRVNERLEGDAAYEARVALLGD